MFDQNLSELRSLAVDAPFVEQIRQLLDHLYDFPYLQHHALARRLPGAAQMPGDTTGQTLRRQLIKAIESLGPEPGTSFRSAQSRVYNMLQLRYVEGMTVLEAAHKLSISPRQAHRDLRRGEENVAEWLWAALEPDMPSPQDEIERMDVDLRAVNAAELVDRARSALDKLAEAYRVNLAFESPAQPPWVSADAMVAQQVLVGILSHVVKQSGPGCVDLRLTEADNQTVELSICYPTREDSDGASLDPLIGQLSQRMLWAVRDGSQPGTGERANDSASGCLLHLSMPKRGKVALLIDDNEDLISLLDRYLSNQPCRPVRAASGAEGLALARELKPDVIVLDVMLPNLDGWETLQLLRNDPRTSHIPIIICSVFHDPELALSLGASLLLRKPVGRQEFLEALRLAGAL